jgi:uncharacterized membrane protein YedE/YeeE
MTAVFAERGFLSTEASLVLAPVIGVGFGWFLERGGLGDSPKLAAQFYFVDLRVFKVMFSALLTAMLGVFWFDRLGMLDLGLIAVPETYLLPQIVGGLLFGVGFLIAGLCPGTSCVAVSAGKVDGLAVVAGLFLGVVAFNIFYRWIASFYESTPRGVMTLVDVTGLSRGLVVALVTMLALAGFALAEHIERRAA